MTTLPRISVITTERLRLAPLQVIDAAEMAPVLDDTALHEFIGGQPATPGELHDTYARMLLGPSLSSEAWLNWIARRRSDDRAIGTLQATVGGTAARCTAQVAWVVGVPWQSRGYASEAAIALVGWLVAAGVHDVVAHIHPDHHASVAVAARAGLVPTNGYVDGEQVWRLVPPVSAI